MTRYARAVIRRAVTWVSRQVGRRRVRVTADRGFAEGALCTLLTAWGVACVIRVQKRTKRWSAGVGRQRDTRRFAGHTRRRTLGHRLYGVRNPQARWGTMSRTRDAHGQWGRWSWVTNRP
jgi:hypothetical protein